MDSPQNTANKIISIWQEHFRSRSHHHDLDWLTLHNSVLSQIPQSNLMTAIFSYADLSIFHINQAAANLFGFTVEEVLHAGAPLLFSTFNDDQVKFGAFEAEQTALELRRAKNKNLLNSYTCYANWVINNRNGAVHRVLFRTFPIELNEHGLPLTGMYLIHDIKPFTREKAWWMRTMMDGKTFFHFKSEEGKFLRKDLLTNREKSILSLLGEGFSSKEIAASLHVSPHTIDNHRRKMLAKTGAVDTSALIHIAKLSGLL